MPSRDAKSIFLSEYAIDDVYLVRPDRKNGRAGLIRARTKDARDVLIRMWPRNKSADDSDLEIIWRSEIRQLFYLYSLPRADDLFVNMLSSGKDKDGFYIVIDPGTGSPLKVFQNSSRKPQNMARIRTPKARRLMWENIGRLVDAIKLLHSQGIIHRNVDAWSVVTALDDAPDFRLTGFEWTMRIASIREGAREQAYPGLERQSFSFAQDWSDLAIMSAELLEIPVDQVRDLKVIASKVSDYASSQEVRLLRAMLGIERVERLDGDYISRVIQQIVDNLSAEVDGTEAMSCLSVRTGSGSRISEAIRRASCNQVEIDDEELQMQFIREDIGEQAQLVSISTGYTSIHCIVGQLLTYKISPYRRPGTDDQPTWEFAVLEHADEKQPPANKIIGKATIPSSSIDIVNSRLASQQFIRRKGKVKSWSNYIEKSLSSSEGRKPGDSIFDAFAILLILEIGYAAADVFAVDILKTAPGDEPDQRVYYVCSRRDEQREDLSVSLGLDAPPTRFSNLLQSDSDQGDLGWILSEASLGDKPLNGSAWRFVGAGEYEGCECLKFEGAAQEIRQNSWYLVSASMIGRIAQFKRRLKALSALRYHGELLRMLADPRMRIENSHDVIDEQSDEFKALDASKQAAVREILSVIPLFLLQGPPGVGKTFLVGDLVNRKLADDPSSRILLSAQSNSAIDHLMSEIRSVISKREDDQMPLMVRARSVDDDDASGDLEIDVQAEKLLDALVNSELLKSSDVKIRERVERMATTGRKRLYDTSAGRGVGAERKAFEGMILRAANLVFATTNSAAVERLIEEQSLFDWSVIEEAGKATGGELLSPMLLSHRRLMLGDHKQLPPFDIEKYRVILSSVSRVRAAVSAIEPLVSRFLKDPSIDEVFKLVSPTESVIEKVCSETMRSLTLFETYVENELERQRKRDVGPRIARRLNEQYRMHPVIARAVSECFYDGELKTNARQAAKYQDKQGPLNVHSDGGVPKSPIVFVNMPYARAERSGGANSESAPPWSNTREAEVVVGIIAALDPIKGPVRPSIAILSPYRRQLAKIKNIVDRSTQSQNALSRFSPGIDGKEYFGTVDSFQGGEADIIIVSLVRNNHHTRPDRALGFLRDERRMNVLLSRARWKMIIVGSLPFFRRVVTQSKAEMVEDMAFLMKFINFLDKERDHGGVSIVNGEDVLTGRPLC